MNKDYHNILKQSLLTFPIIGLLNLFGVPPVNVPKSISAELLSQNHENSAQMASQSTEVPMKLEFVVEQEMYIMTVPNRDISQSAYGGKLRFYDVHIAKMFEMTYDDCQRIQRRFPQGIDGMSWLYKPGNGDDSITPELFYISCSLAYEIVDTYGLGKAEQTVVESFVENQAAVYTETRSIQTLNITGSKVPQWIDFVRGFQLINDVE